MDLHPYDLTLRSRCCSLNEALDEDGSGRFMCDVRLLSSGLHPDRVSSIELEELEAFWNGNFQFDQ